QLILVRRNGRYSRRCRDLSLRVVHFKMMRVPRGIGSGGSRNTLKTLALEKRYMKPILRYQSHLLFRKSYKPKRVIRIRPAQRLTFVFRPVNRFGVKPKLLTVL